MENIFEKIHKEYQNSTQSNEEILDDNFDKEKYSKFYDIINNVILYFVLNSYETYFLSLKEDFSISNFNEKISDEDKILNYLRAQLNIYWSELSEKKSNSNDQLIIDLQDSLNLDIIKHKACLFTFIKNLSISIIKSISKMNIAEVSNFNDAKEKIAKISHAILIINKETGLEDEDDFDCDGCEYKSLENSKYFWN
jgi:hypothetical protein